MLPTSKCPYQPTRVHAFLEVCTCYNSPLTNKLMLKINFSSVHQRETAIQFSVYQNFQVLYFFISLNEDT